MATATTAPAVGATLVGATLDEVLRRAHDAYATTVGAREVLDRYERVKRDRDEGTPGAFWEDIDSPEALGAVRAAAGEVARACRTQSAAVRALVAAAREGGAAAGLTLRGPALADGLEVTIDAGTRHARIVTGRDILHVEAYDECLTRNGLPVVGDPWVYELPGWLGLDPDAAVPQDLLVEGAGTAEEGQ
ncbi:hypothetical protein [Actinomyces gaoshouyii]|uniref:hypothetical protein n=1 Tax=Actinomyces gaoshouyii TaxID=1960083 RepID=UPI0009BE563D|nr:hypothetical protein [Actinomyces gaoshouyii]ARD42473.1 hypothetical protein B6G06_09095 [Actinomyces gaoshouyii]